MHITGTHINYFHVCRRKLWLFANGINMEERSGWYTIVGVAADVRDNGVTEDAPTTVYWPQVAIDTGQTGWRRGTQTVVLSTSVEPTSVNVIQVLARPRWPTPRRDQSQTPSGKTASSRARSPSERVIE